MLRYRLPRRKRYDFSSTHYKQAHGSKDMISSSEIVAQLILIDGYMSRSILCSSGRQQKVGWRRSCFVATANPYKRALSPEWASVKHHKFDIVN